MRHIYCDGACFRNPGEMGAGMVVFYENDETVPSEKYSWYLGRGTSQTAELAALREALKLAEDGDQIRTNSRYAFRMVEGWKAKNNIELISEIKELLAHKRVSVEWVRRHSDNLQMLAETLANEAALTRLSRLEPPLRSSLTESHSGKEHRVTLWPFRWKITRGIP